MAGLLLTRTHPGREWSSSCSSSSSTAGALCTRLSAYTAVPRPEPLFQSCIKCYGNSFLSGNPSVAGAFLPFTSTGLIMPHHPPPRFALGRSLMLDDSQRACARAFLPTCSASPPRPRPFARPLFPPPPSVLNCGLSCLEMAPRQTTAACNGTRHMAQPGWWGAGRRRASWI